MLELTKKNNGEENNIHTTCKKCKKTCKNKSQIDETCFGV